MTLPALSLALPLACVCALAFAMETALGFGAALVTVALGSFFIDLRELLPALVPLNLLLSYSLVARNHTHVDRAFLFRRLLPAMALGLPIGLVLFTSADASLLKRIFGGFVLAAALAELASMAPSGSRRPLSSSVALALLFAGGIVHGAFSTGGPMAVYVTGRVIEDKARYRATLSSLWAVLGTGILVTYAATGRLTATSGTLSLVLLPAIAVGMAVGEAAFRRVPIHTFRRVVFVTLALTGLMLLVRG